MTNLIPFTFESHEVRTLTDDQDENWFILRDVLNAMGTTVKTNVAKQDIAQGLGDGYTSDIPILDSLGRKQWGFN